MFSIFYSHQDVLEKYPFGQEFYVGGNIDFR